MVGVPQPLADRFAIVDANGMPTPYFTRWAQKRQSDLSTAITSAQANALIAAYVAAHPLQAGSGITITPDGKLSNNPTITAAVQAILDQITTTRGSVLYRGASAWAALAPGTAGQVLQTNGAGADPTWVTPSGGSGSGSGWTALTFGTTSGTRWGRTFWQSNESKAVATGDFVEVEIVGKRASATDFALAFSGDGASCVQIVVQNDDNRVAYSYTTTGGASTVVGTANAGSSGAQMQRLWLGITIGNSTNPHHLDTRAMGPNVTYPSGFVTETAVALASQAAAKFHVSPSGALSNLVSARYRVWPAGGV